MTDPRPSPIEWREGEPPRSRLFGDVYYSAEDGLAESRQVFLAGCGMPEIWRERRSFCVGELGFGTGLNAVALLDLWRRRGPPNARLNLFAVEAYPLPAADAARALAAWPELAPITATLLARWPGRARGFHRVELPQLRAILDVAVMEAADALAAWTGSADAWFLDGFSPTRNPQMWRPQVLDLVGRRSAPGARLATYTAAGEVRRGLAAGGFDVKRVQGFGAKRHRLEARWPGEVAPASATPRVAIVGAGIAGASLARAFAALGAPTTVIDAAVPAAASAPAALVTPRLDAGLGPPAALHAQAFARARNLYLDQDTAITAHGALQLAIGPKDPGRFRAIAGSDLFEAGELRLLGPDEAAGRLGECAPEALEITSALVVDPGRVLTAWRGQPRRAKVAALTQEAGGWRVLDESGATIAEAEIVCIAGGLASADLAPELDLRPVRGQASIAPGAGPAAAVLFGGYVAPTAGGMMFGATHDRDDDSLTPRAEDHGRNLAALTKMLPELAARVAGGPFGAYVAVRATTRDYLPMAGMTAPGLFVLTGLGSRGFTLAPLLGEHLAAMALGAPSPLPATLAELVDPARFVRRQDRRRRRPPG